MTLLLDTHTVLWVAQASPRLGRAARRACDVALAADEVAIPTIVYYELDRLLKRRRIGDASTVRDWRSRILALGVREIPLSVDIALRATDLENLPGDPFDRLIVATALVEHATLLTADEDILAWPGRLSRRDAHR